METEWDLVSALVRIGEGGINFLASCFLYLDPDELKACRLVNRAWDEFIRKEVWGSKRRRLLLKEKLLQRWKNIEPAAKEFGPVRMMLDPDQFHKEVDSIFCNNSYVFCGLPIGKVAVYCLTTGDWVRDLVPLPLGADEEGDHSCRVAGSELVVAAVMWATKVTIWSSKKEMERLFCLHLVNFPCSDVSCEHSGDAQAAFEIEVVGNKVVFLREDQGRDKTSLIVIDKGEQNEWESETLACLDDIDHTSALLATEEDWLAVARTARNRPNTVEVKLWQSNNFRQDISLPEFRSVSAILKIALKLPFIVVTDGDVGIDACVKVYQLAYNNLMEDIRPVATLIKTIQLEEASQMISNELFFGFVLDPDENDTQAVVLIEKKALLDASIPSEETEKRQILLRNDGCWDTVDMNTTSLVSVLWLTKYENYEQGSHDDDHDDGTDFGIDLKEEEERQDNYKDKDDNTDEDLEEEEVVYPLYKKDFWRTSSIE